MELSPEVVMVFVTTVASPFVTQFLKSQGPKFDQYATVVNQMVALAIMSAAWLLVREPSYEVWFGLAMGAGGVSTSLYNVMKSMSKKKKKTE